MKKSHGAVLVFAAGLFVLSGNPVLANGQTQADNTKQNSKPENKKSQTTADSGNANTSDRKLMQQIRKAVVGDKSLSTYGHNVKILADHGKVTLKGPVHTEEEKKTIEDLARKIAGDANVTNEITVKGDKK